MPAAQARDRHCPPTGAIARWRRGRATCGAGDAATALARVWRLRAPAQLLLDERNGGFPTMRHFFLTALLAAAACSASMPTTGASTAPTVFPDTIHLGIE